MKSVALLTNPTAGRGYATLAAIEAKRVLHARGIDVVEISASDDASASRRAAAAMSDTTIDALVVVGGDGLVNLALQHHGTLGVIPAGTGNDFARGHNIPLNPRAAASVIADGFTTTVDLGLMEVGEANAAPDSAAQPPKFFGTIACAGFDALVNLRANKMKWPPGRYRYPAAVVAELARFQAHPCELTLWRDGEAQTIEQPMTLVAVANTKTYGGGMLMCPHADPTDGLFDVTVLHEMTRLSALRRFATVFRGDVTAEPDVDRYQADQVEIRMPGVPRFADGEPIDEHGKHVLRLSVAKGAANIIVPHNG